MKTQNYKITWTTDDTSNLYQRDLVVKTDYDVEEQEATIALYVGDESIYDTFICEEDEIDYRATDFITDNLSWLTECDDKFVVGTTQRGDFVDFNLVD